MGEQAERREGLEAAQLSSEKSTRRDIPIPTRTRSSCCAAYIVTPCSCSMSALKDFEYKHGDILVSW